MAARLRDVEAVLEGIPADSFYVGLSWFETGPRTLPKRKLDPFLRRWLDGLDLADAEARAERSQGFSDMPETVWEEEGWSLAFRAFSRSEASRGWSMRVLQIRGLDARAAAKTFPVWWRRSSGRRAATGGLTCRSSSRS